MPHLSLKSPELLRNSEISALSCQPHQLGQRGPVDVQVEQGYLPSERPEAPAFIMILYICAYIYIYTYIYTYTLSLSIYIYIYIYTYTYAVSEKACKTMTFRAMARGPGQSSYILLRLDLSCHSEIPVPTSHTRYVFSHNSIIVLTIRPDRWGCSMDTKLGISALQIVMTRNGRCAVLPVKNSVIPETACC